jgi:hypothetical protein
MAKQFNRLALPHRTFIAAQHLFFVATAAATGRVNTSPKGMDSLRVLDANRILWRNATGSGNETAGHLRLDPRMTLMWCAFDAQPLILRCYGTARTIHIDEDGWDDGNALFAPDITARQIFDVTIDLVQTSCGFGVPRMAYEAERPDADAWSAGKGQGGIVKYWDEVNRTTIDGFPTGIEANL